MLTADSHVSIVRPRTLDVNPWFGMTLMKNQATFEALGTGSTEQTELSRHDIGSVQIVLPPSRIRFLYGERAWPLIKPISNLVAQNENLTAIRDLLLPKLVTAQIDVSTLNLDGISEADE